jgi:soluble lytic murein transglycosylase-like protein
MYSCILFFSLLNGLDPAFTQSVITVESRGNPFAMGSLDDTGLLQIRAKFVPETSLQLMQPCTNVMRGTQLLGDLKKKHKGVDRTWINCYNLGSRGCRRLKHPKKFAYYKKVMAVYDSSYAKKDI